MAEQTPNQDLEHKDYIGAEKLGDTNTRSNCGTDFHSSDEEIARLDEVELEILRPYLFSNVDRDVIPLLPPFNEANEESDVDAAEAEGANEPIKEADCACADDTAEQLDCFVRSIDTPGYEAGNNADSVGRVPYLILLDTDGDGEDSDDEAIAAVAKENSVKEKLFAEDARTLCSEMTNMSGNQKSDPFADATAPPMETADHLEECGLSDKDGNGLRNGASSSSGYRDGSRDHPNNGATSDSANRGNADNNHGGTSTPGTAGSDAILLSETLMRAMTLSMKIVTDLSQTLDTLDKYAQEVNRMVNELCSTVENRNASS